MTADEARLSIKNMPIGATIQLIKKTGAIVEVQLASLEVSGTAFKDYGSLQIPALPPALIVRGGTRFGNFRMDVEDIIHIARIA